MNDAHAGGCRCNAVRFTAAGAPIRVANCHCRSCRKATGAAFATFVDFPRGDVNFMIAPHGYQSSPGAERLFCGVCGSPLGYRGDSSTNEINLLIGAFDRPERFAPTSDCHQEFALWR